MKSHTLPALALVTLAAAASAQTVPVKRTSANELFSAGVTYSSVSDIGGSGESGNGVTLDARVSVTNGVFLLASYTDGSKVNDGGFTITPSSYGIGLGTKLPAGNGSVELSYTFRHLDLDIAPTPPVDDTTDQHWLKAAYSLDLGNGLDVSLGVTQILNSQDGFDDVTAPEVSVGYKFGQGFSAKLGFATEDTLLGLPDSGNTVSVGVRYGF